MSDQIEKYNQLKNEVADFRKELESSDEYAKVKDKLRDFQILLSPLQFQPDFMIIGINPGAGSYNVTGKLSHQLEPQSKMEYVNSTYSLAAETKKVFELAGLSKDDLSKAVKTNFYFVATENQDTLKYISRDIKVIDFEKKSKDWNKRLIEMIQPKIILCEGKSAFSKVLEHDNLNANWNGDVAHTQWGNIHVIGYSRRYSQIRDKEKLSSIIKEYDTTLLHQ